SRCAVLHRFSYSFSPFCFHHPATPEIYTLSLHDALPIWLVSMAALYGAYAWIALSAVAGNITVGGMTMYLLVFKQGQSALSAILSAIGGMYEDNLYLSNLYEFLEHPTAESAGTAERGPAPGRGLELVHVSFRYPGTERLAIDDLSLHLRPGEKLALVGDNGAGKTTLIKLIAG